MVVDVDVTVQFDHARPDVLRIANPDKLVLLHDHVVPAPTVQAANNAKRMREFVERFGIENYFPVGQHGISHVLVAEEGYALPGQILVNADSHTCSSGAMNCLARGMGPSEMLYILCKGETWYLVGPDHEGRARGRAARARATRATSSTTSRGSTATSPAATSSGTATASPTIGIDGRLTMATISAELSAEFSLFPYDDVLAEYLEGRAKWPFEPAHPDDDAEYEQIDHRRPLVARAAGRAARQGGVEHARARARSPSEQIKVDQAFIGSCANGRLSDFADRGRDPRRPAGRARHPHDRHARQPGHPEAGRSRLGYVETLMDAGAVVTNSTCGACFGGHMGLLADDEVCITASTRNFQGRMGSPKASVFMGSPATVAASAVTGVITDPRDL